MAVDFTMYSGDSKEIAIDIDKPDGSAQDVSAAQSATFVIVHKYTYAALVTKTLGAGITIAADVVTVTLDPADTDDLAGSYRHELSIIDSSGEVFTALQGDATIERDYA